MEQRLRHRRMRRESRKLLRESKRVQLPRAKQQYFRRYSGSNLQTGAAGRLGYHHPVLGWHTGTAKAKPAISPAGESETVSAIIRIAAAFVFVLSTVSA